MFTLAYDAAARQLVGTWAGPVGEGELRGHYAELLAAAQAHGHCPYWLFEMPVRDWHTPGMGRWFREVFAPAAHAALRQPLFIACVVSPSFAPIANSPNMQAVQFGCVEHEVYPLFFITRPAAEAWLTHHQAFAPG